MLSEPTPSLPRAFAKHRGFTLVEMAFVIVIASLVMMGLLPALNAVRISSQRSVTQSNLNALMLATASFVQANGCLPCPVPPRTVDAGVGAVRGDNSASPAPCGSCSIVSGTVPFASLGVPLATAKDGWGHWISMRVDPALTGNSSSLTVIAPPASPCLCKDFSLATLPSGCATGTNGTTLTATCTVLNAAQKGLCRSGLSKTNSLTVFTPNASATPASQSAAIIFVSHGALGFGSFYRQSVSDPSNGSQIPFPNPVACSTSQGYAECNAQGFGTSSAGQFYNASTVVGGNDPYDDMMVFADRNNLVSMLGNAACQTTW